MDLIEVTRDIDLPEDIYGSELFQDTLRAACDVVCWTNDVYSLNKETALGEYHNLVTVVEHNRGLTRAEALEESIRRIDAKVQAFLGGERQVLTAWPEHEGQLSRYLSGMRSWMRGNRDWSARTRRYQVSTGAGSPADYLDPVADPKAVRDSGIPHSA
jgi:hypothetical protein